MGWDGVSFDKDEPSWVNPVFLLFLQKSNSCGFTSLGATAQTWSFQPQQDVGLDVPQSRPLIVAHRGASGMFPEHTSIAYEKAMEQASPHMMTFWDNPPDLPF